MCRQQYRRAQYSRVPTTVQYYTVGPHRRWVQSLTWYTGPPVQSLTWYTGTPADVGQSVGAPPDVSAQTFIGGQTQLQTDTRGVVALGSRRQLFPQTPEVRICSGKSRSRSKPGRREAGDGRLLRVKGQATAADQGYAPPRVTAWITKACRSDILRIKVKS